MNVRFAPFGRFLFVVHVAWRGFSGAGTSCA